MHLHRARASFFLMKDIELFFPYILPVFHVYIIRAECYDKIGTWILDMICPIGAWRELFVPRCTLYMFLSFSSENVSLY